METLCEEYSVTVDFHPEKKGSLSLETKHT